MHLRQGDLDGACGPYCLLMCLLICGVAYRDELTSLEQIDGRTNTGKILKMLADYSGFFRDGTKWIDLCAMLEASYPRKLDFDIAIVSGAALKPFIEGHIEQNHPLILSVRWNDGAHWVVVVGLEYELENGHRKLARLLILDP